MNRVRVPALIIALLLIAASSILAQVPPQPGDLVITEFMFEPDAVPDASGEWFEIANMSSNTIELAGLTIGDEGTDSFTIPSSPSRPLPAGEFFLFGKTGDQDLNGGVYVDYAYDGAFNFVNPADDQIIIRSGATVIDEVWVTSAFAIIPGVSMHLDESSYSAVLNDDPANWYQTWDCSLPDGDQGCPSSFYWSEQGIPLVDTAYPGAGAPAGGDIVTIDGTNLAGATDLTIGGVPVVSWTVVGDHTLTCVTPPHSLGNVDIVVTSAAGAGTLTDGFTYLDPAWDDVATVVAGEPTQHSMGVAWGDYDDDGDLDLYVGNYALGEVSALYRNDGASGFTDVTPPLLADVIGAWAVAWGDVDNDGDLDLYLGRYGPNKLFLNNGDGSFTDGTTPPLDDGGYVHSIAWGDYDNDGLIDLYIANDAANKLLHNEGGGAFSDVTVGPEGDASYTFGAAWVDYDDDGDLDLYLANNYSEPDKLLRNDGLSGFTDVTPPSLGETTSSVGMAWGDYDNDGDLDLYLGREAGVPNQLMRNNGGGAFTDVTAGPLGELGEARCVIWGDYDNDGDLDLYLPMIDGTNKLLRNDGLGVFTDVADPVLADPEISFGAAWGDYDNDGDLDIYQANWGGPNRLFRNMLDNGNHWLHIDLTGTVSNAVGIGARIRVVAGGASQIRVVSGGSGSTSQGSLTAEFGLGTSAVVDSVQVSWPSGGTQELTGVAVDQRIEVVEPFGSTPDWVNLQWPPSIPVIDGCGSPPIYGRVYVAGVTEAEGQGPGIEAWVGYGPVGSDPGTSVSWTWNPAEYNTDAGNDDEYAGTFVPAGGTEFDYCFRFRRDGGPFVYGDLDGSDNGYSPDQAGSVQLIDPTEPQWCNLQWPPSIVMAAGGESPGIYGQVYFEGITDHVGAGCGIEAQCGYGTDGTDPGWDSSWQWSAAAYNTDVGDNDEYVAALTVDPTGTYDYCYRFRINGGSWVYGDLDGSDNGYSVAQAGSLTVVEGAEVGDRVWLDQNSNGIQDAGEPGKSGVFVTLFRADGELLATTMSAFTTGGYSFVGLAPGDYYLTFQSYAGDQFSPWDVGDDEHDSDMNGTLGRTEIFTLTAGQVDHSWDCGFRDNISGIGAGDAPRTFALHQNYPNPFNPMTTIAFELPRQAIVNLRVFDVTGRLVRTLIDARGYDQGRYEVIWRGTSDSGRPCPSGTYFCRLDAGAFGETQRMVLLK